MSGKLLVLEGTDASGKSTQFERLCQALDARGIEYRRLVFPRYKEESSALIRMYLGGQFGTHPDVLCCGQICILSDRVERLL